MAKTRKRKTAAENGLAELSKKIDEQLEHLDELQSAYYATTDSDRSRCLRESVRSARRTIERNRQALRKLDGGY